MSDIDHLGKTNDEVNSLTDEMAVRREEVMAAELTAKGIDPGLLPRDGTKITDPSVPMSREKSHQYHFDAKQAWMQHNLRWETENAFLNHQILYEYRMKGRVKCLSELPKQRGPCIICGSGSTLDGIIDYLKDWVGGVLCSTSQGTTLVAHGRAPDFLSCLDPRAAPDREMDVPEGGWDKTTYLAHVSTPKAYFDQWLKKGERPAFVFRILEPTYMWYTRHLPWAYPWVKVNLLPFIDSASSMVTLASYLGYDPIFMIGIDYGGPRFTQSIWDGKQWNLRPGTQKPYPSSTRKDENDQPIDRFPLKPGPSGLPTDDGMMYAKRGFLISSFLQMKSRRVTRLYQMSKPSNVVEFPFADWRTVVANCGSAPGWTDAFRDQVCEAVEVELAKSDTYMVPIESGFGTDYRVYMMEQANIVQGLSALSVEMLTNKADLVQKEKELRMSVKDLIRRDILKVESGELLIHEDKELDFFDVHKMAGVDVEKVGAHIHELYEKSKA